MSENLFLEKFGIFYTIFLFKRQWDAEKWISLHFNLWEIKLAIYDYREINGKEQKDTFSNLKTSI